MVETDTDLDPPSDDRDLLQHSCIGETLTDRLTFTKMKFFFRLTFTIRKLFLNFSQREVDSRKVPIGTGQHWAVSYVLRILISNCRCISLNRP